MRRSPPNIEKVVTSWLGSLFMMTQPIAPAFCEFKALGPNSHPPRRTSAILLVRSFWIETHPGSAC